jgi:hypothetical protein
VFESQCTERDLATIPAMGKDFVVIFLHVDLRFSLRFAGNNNQLGHKYRELLRIVFNLIYEI